MLDRMGRDGGALSSSRMMNALDIQLAQVERILARRDDIDACIVGYDEALSDPRGIAQRVASFVGGDLDVDAMVGVVDRDLRRQVVETDD